MINTSKVCLCLIIRGYFNREGIILLTDCLIFFYFMPMVRKKFIFWLMCKY